MVSVPSDLLYAIHQLCLSHMIISFLTRKQLNAAFAKGEKRELVKGYHNVKTKEIKKALLLISGNYIHFACFSAPLWNASTGITAKRCQCQQDWHGQCPFLGGFVENTGRFEGPDKTVPEPSTHSLVLLPGSWNTPLVPVTFFQFGGGNRAKFTLPKGQVLHPETSHHVSYSLHCGFILTLVAKEYGYVATHSPFSSESWEAKMPCNILKVTGT